MKLYNWIVIWYVVVNVSVPCPDYKPDPYTGEYPSTHCLAIHTKPITKSMQKEFDTKKEAQEFIRNAPSEIKGRMTLDYAHHN